MSVSAQALRNLLGRSERAATGTAGTTTGNTAAAGPATDAAVRPLKPETKVIDTATMARAYRGATSDGTLTFDAASAPEVAAMAPGTMAIFAGVALLRVSSVTAAGGKIAVAGTPVGLEDAIDHEHNAWSTPLDFT